MDQSDRFSGIDNDDRTIIRPSPGGRRRQGPLAQPPGGGFASRTEFNLNVDFPSADNTIVANAFSLLSVVLKLRNVPFHPTVNELQEQLASELRIYKERSLQQGCSQEQVKIAGYFLCSLIDETVLNTPWGNQSNWGHHSLLVQLYGEASGGERFFQILIQLKQQWSQNLQLLELAYLCLSLGFEGKYRITGSGMRELERLRHELYLLIYRAKGDSEQSLSPRWQGLRGVRSPLGRQVPLWIPIVVAGALLVVIYMGFAYMINKSSDGVYKQLAMLQDFAANSRVSKQSETSPTISWREKYAALLSDEIARKMVEVLDGKRLRITDAFASGSDQIKKQFIPMLAKIAKQLQIDEARAVVVGHTDNRPIFSARFPSNWHLSHARAKHVANIMATSASISLNIGFEGHADSEPIVPNDTAQNRARNRRIEILIR